MQLVYEVILLNKILSNHLLSENLQWNSASFNVTINYLMHCTRSWNFGRQQILSNTWQYCHAILTVCCEDDYFSKGKFKLFNSLFHSMYLVFPISLFSIADLFAVGYLRVICNEDKCCVVTQGAADIRVVWLVYVRTYCVPIATWNQNKRTRLLYLGDSQIKKLVIKGIADIMQRLCQSVSSGMHGNTMGLGPDLKI